MPARPSQAHQCFRFFTAHSAVFALVLLFALSTHSFSKEADKPADDADTSVKGLKVPPGFKVEMWTSKKQVIDPVAMAFDDQNRLYVCETFRFRDGGGLDVREHKFLYLEDMLCVTTEDRRALYAKYKDKFKPDYFTANKEKIVLLEDTQNKGKADKVSVFAEAFNDALDGPGVGLAWNDGKLYYACVPKIWELTGATGNGPVEKINTFFDGFGVRVSISGHDVHGTIVGPDGKLYWSMGDRGYNVTGREGQHFVNPHTGGVFRANLDGSGLERYYNGLRNPQELAFDEYGNLFTVDNNADIGDASRLTYVLEGGDTGWTTGWQMLGYADFPKLAGIGDKKPDSWLEEGMWKMRFEQQPAWILPPVGLITNGPCGFAYYPGTGLPDAYAKHFFICDYTAGSNSGVYSFTAEEDGAGFVMKNAEKFLWGLTATDVAFGYDGRVYVVDYGGGWNLPGKGSIVTVSDPNTSSAPIVQEVRKLFADGFGKLDTPRLAALLKHVDMRVRQRAQFELAKRGKEGFAALNDAAKTPGHTLSRVHGIWGMGQMAREMPEALPAITALLSDSDARVREQAVKMLSDARYTPAMDKLLPMLTDASVRVKTFAAIALGKMNCRTDVPALIDILRDNADKDAFLRHAAVMGLVGASDAEALKAHATDSSKAVRLGALLAMRRLSDPDAALFLKDSDPLIYAEAVRAIYDAPIMPAMAALAAEMKRIVAKPDELKAAMTPLLYLRILNANYRYGNGGNAALIAEFAATASVPENVRIAALGMLNDWAQPTVIDPVLGLPRPVAKREKLVVDETIKASLKKLLAENGAISARAVELALAFGIELSDDLLLSFVKDTKRGEAIRVTSLQQLQSKKNKALAALLPQLATDGSMTVRVAALGALIESDEAAGLKAAEEILEGKGPPPNAIGMVIDRSNGDWNALKMGAPAKTDYADQSSGNNVVFSYVKGYGEPNVKAGAKDGKLPRLNDGLAAENDDDVARCVWIDARGSRILCDLQKPIDIGAVNTFSWHLRDRAPQHFVLWGSAKEKPDAAAKELKKDWTQIAAVNTFPLNEGGKHGSMIYNAGGSVGQFRYLLWQSEKQGSGTFYTEMDIYEKGKWQYTPMADLRLQQQVFQLLGKAPSPAAGELVLEWLDKMASGKLAPVLHLDLIEAADMRKEEKVVKRMEAFRKGFPETDKLAAFRTALVGGDVKCGEEIFQFHAAGCLKCHKIGGAGHEAGGEAGPKLGGVGTRLTREKLLESLIDPSAVIVPGYGATTFRMQDGTMLTGSITDENPTEITIKQSDGKVLKIQVAEIKKRSQPVSPMPPMGPLMKPREIRDLIEYLSTLK